ncbi:SoxR reducing system RseC family protein [Aliiglaciecola sp. M165]|uniref:SoxR reducing system RseC family protein n=1 Tax=Aliiglaciecola sp. M165 TaxID=2593649 RepID=UPI00117BEE8A|nr:SoxR reducing system RseC family protein [Aliiglaciecola sp. M165]TRY30853.1 SoxR reducing system RseC family protein [Aliiglaciecola sp. M165]
MIEEIGVITAVDKDHIWVETQIKTTCGSCQAQDNCGTGVVAKAFAPKKDKLILRCKQAAKVGQRVKLGIEENHLLGASALVYLLPLIMLIATAVSAQNLFPAWGLEHELWVIAVSFVVTAFTFAWIRAKAKNSDDHRLQPKLLAILPPETDVISVKQAL